MAVRVEQLAIAPSTELVVHVGVRNERDIPVDYSVPSCGEPFTVIARLPLPADPPGQTWDGIAEAFKRYALTQGLGPGAIPALRPIDARAPAYPCDGFQGERQLGAGETIESTLRLRPELTPGVPALPGDVDFDITFGYDRQNGPPSRDPNDTGPIGLWFPIYKELATTGRFSITGSALSIITPGQAIDAVLGDQRFASWLAALPETTWTNANLYLQTATGEGDVIPQGPWWTVELFRENGVPRNWAIAVVDPFGGAVAGVTICANPCDR